MHLKLHLTHLRAERAEGFCHVGLKVWAGRSDAVGISSNNKNHSRIITAEQKEEYGQGLASGETYLLERLAVFMVPCSSSGKAMPA